MAAARTSWLDAPSAADLLGGVSAT